MLVRRKILEKTLEQGIGLISARGVKSSSRKRSSKLPVVLNKDVEKLGKKGEQVLVEPGFARNWLIPQLLAKYDVNAGHGERQPKTNTPGPKKRYEDNLARQFANMPVEQKQLHQILHRLQAAPVGVAAAMKDGEELRKSLTAESIAAAVAKQKKIAMDKRLIKLQQPITRAGLHDVPLGITLGNGEAASIQIIVSSQ